MNTKTDKRIALQKDILGCLRYNPDGIMVRGISDILCPSGMDKDYYYERTHRMMYRIIAELERQERVEYTGNIRYRKLKLKNNGQRKQQG